MKIFVAILLITFTLNVSASERVELDFKVYLNNDLTKSGTIQSYDGELKTVVAGEQLTLDITPFLDKFTFPLTSVTLYKAEGDNVFPLINSTLVTEFDKSATVLIGSEDIDTDTYRIEIYLKGK